MDIKTELPVVYVKQDKLEILPYLDLARKDEVWGVQLGDLLWCKSPFKETDWCNAMNSAKKCVVAGKNATLPLLEQLIIMFDQKDIFDRTMVLFQENEIEAGEWLNEWYWAQNLAHPSAYVFSMMNASVLRIHKTINEAHSRFVVEL